MFEFWQTIAKFQKIQLDNLVDFEKCCKTHIFLQNRCRYSRKRATFCRKFAEFAEFCRFCRSVSAGPSKLSHGLHQRRVRKYRSKTLMPVGGAGRYLGCCVAGRSSKLSAAEVQRTNYTSTGTDEFELLVPSLPHPVLRQRDLTG